MFVGQSEIGGAFNLRIDRGRGRYQDRSRNRNSKTLSDTEGDSGPDSDTDGAFQADLSDLITKASGFAGG